MGRIWIGCCRWPFKPVKGKNCPLLNTFSLVNLKPETEKHTHTHYKLIVGVFLCQMTWWPTIQGHLSEKMWKKKVRKRENSTLFIFNLQPLVCKWQIDILISRRFSHALISLIFIHYLLLMWFIWVILAVSCTSYHPMPFSSKRTCPCPQHISSSWCSAKWLNKTSYQTRGQKWHPLLSVCKFRHHWLASRYWKMLDMGSS